MSEMHCRVIIYLAALATTLSQIAGELFVAPRNTESKIGETTYFNCSTDLGHSEIFWHHGDKDIYTGNGILEPYRGRFEIDRNASIGSHNLVIHSVEPGDAGEYICADDEGYRERLSAQLIVLDNDPDCQSNIQPDGVIGQNIFNIAPDEVQLTCTVTYHGNIPPQLEWRKVGDVNSSTKDSVTSNVTSSNRLICTLRLEGDIALDKSSYVCQTKRSIQNQYKCTSEIVKVLYFIGGNMIEQNVIRGGDITCMAGYSTFPCISQWYQSNYTYLLSSDETITVHVLGEYFCMVRCIVRGKDYSFEAMKVVVVEPTTTPPPSATVISVVVVTLVLVGVLIFVFIWIVRRKRRIKLEIHIIIKNYQFLVENIKSNRLIDLLHEKKCITSEKRDDLRNQPYNYFLNDALLQWMRTITFNEDKFQMVLDCLRQDEQNFIADGLKKGGVFIKSTTSTNLLNERHWSSKNMDALKEKKAMVIDRLNQMQGLLLSNSQSAISEMADDNIFIAPYCHQEPDGIVIWFLCQSKTAKKMLKSMHESGILLEKLTTIFKEFSCDSMSSVSEILVPNTIFIGDFTKTENEYLKSPTEEEKKNPVPSQKPENEGTINIAENSIAPMENHPLLVTEHPAQKEEVTEILICRGKMLQKHFQDKPEDETDAEDEDVTNKRLQNDRLDEFHEPHTSLPKRPEICGLAILDQDVFMLRLQSSDIEVYDSRTFHFKRRLAVERTIFSFWSVDIVSCSINNCLYVSDRGRLSQPPSIIRIDPSIIRIDPTTGNTIKVWETSDGGCISIASDTNVILSIINRGLLLEYTAHGELIRKIDLRPGTDIRGPRHAVKLPNGQFVICQGDSLDPIRRVCLLSTKETTRDEMCRTDEVEIVKEFCQEGESLDSLWQPRYLSLDKEGSVLVLDGTNDRAVLLSSNLDKPQIIISEKDGMKMLRRTCFDESTGEWFVADDYHVMVCRVKEEEVERKHYSIIRH